MIFPEALDPFAWKAAPPEAGSWKPEARRFRKRRGNQHPASSLELPAVLGGPEKKQC